MSDRHIIEVSHLNAGYDGVTVLRDLSFNILDGEFVSLIGKSGCGKSTLLLALAGFIQSEGNRSVPSQIGMVFQNYAVFPWLTVKENILFGLGAIEEDERKRTLAHYLQLVELEEQCDKYPTQLSGGQVQRVALARALAPNPSVIFMDEPFGALDIFTRDKMQDWLNHIWEKENKTVVFVTHNIEEAIVLSDRILIMGNSKILEEVRPPFPRPRSIDIKYSPQFTDLKRDLAEKLEASQV